MHAGVPGIEAVTCCPWICRAESTNDLLYARRCSSSVSTMTPSQSNRIAIFGSARSRTTAREGQQYARVRGMGHTGMAPGARRDGRREEGAHSWCWMRLRHVRRDGRRLT